MLETLIFFIYIMAVIAVLFIVSSLAWVGILSAPYVPTRKRDLKRIYEIAQIRPGQVVYDLGAGDGRILIYGAKHYGIKGVGCELALFPLLSSKIKALCAGVSGQLSLRWKNLYKIDVSEADLVVSYLLPKTMGKLKKKFEQELKPGAKVIACGFEVPGWEHVKYDKPDKRHVGLYLYQR